MYQYNIDNLYDKKQDELRLLRFSQNAGDYQLVYQWPFHDIAQSITAMVAMNSIQSPLLFCATSNK
jgi:hypothetical protein